MAELQQDQKAGSGLSRGTGLYFEGKGPTYIAILKLYT